MRDLIRVFAVGVGLGIGARLGTGLRGRPRCRFTPLEHSRSCPGHRLTRTVFGVTFGEFRIKIPPRLPHTVTSNAVRASTANGGRSDLCEGRSWSVRAVESF